jgi:tetratricopeptide (TPR) repeat protein
LAIFGGKKKKEDAGSPEANGQGAPEPKGAGSDEGGVGKGGKGIGSGGGKGGAEPGPTFNPEAAERFFEHARTAHDTTNYEYAMNLWLSGLRQDASNMTAMEGFFRSAAAYAAANPKKKPKVDLQVKTPVDKFLASLLNWGTRLTDGDAAMRAGDAAANAGLDEQGYWCLERAMTLAKQAKRPSPLTFKKLMQLFARVGAYSEAVEAGTIAVQINPADSDLANAVKNFSAQATMSQGGYDQVGEEGGFRKNIRNAAKQKQLQDEEAISKDEGTIERLIERARVDLEARPEDPPAITALAKRLIERGTPNDEKEAYELYKRAYQLTKEFRFRQSADDIKMRAWRRRLAALEKKAAENPADDEIREKLAQERKNVLDAETKVYAARSEAYPTDNLIKYELGRRYFDLGQFDDAIANLQQAQGEPKLRVRTLHMLAQSFLAMGWGDEAVTTFRQTLDAHGRDSDEIGMSINYGLMDALLTKATDHRDLEAIIEADKIASSIAIRDIGFKEVRTKRDAIKKLLAELRQG